MAKKPFPPTKSVAEKVINIKAITNTGYKPSNPSFILLII